jgi:ABC-type amino acid transport substrate-binding protein
MIISSITKLPSRESEHHIKFSQAYFCTGQSLLYRKADWTTDVPIRDMLKGKTVGYREGTTSAKLVAKLVAAAGQDAPRTKPFLEAESMLQSLAAPTSSIQAVMTDTPFALDALFRQGIGGRLASKPFSKSDYPASVAREELIEEYALAVAQGETELLDAINRTIMKLKIDKTLDKILEEAAAAKFPSLAPSTRAQLYAQACSD